MWRPEGWKNPIPLSFSNEHEAYEEGADAMLKKLELQTAIYVQGMETASEPSIVSVQILNKKGMWVFIPDETP